MQVSRCEYAHSQVRLGQVTENSLQVNIDPMIGNACLRLHPPAPRNSMLLRKSTHVFGASPGQKFASGQTVFASTLNDGGRRGTSISIRREWLLNGIGRHACSHLLANFFPSPVPQVGSTWSGETISNNEGRRQLTYRILHGTWPIFRIMQHTLHITNDTLHITHVILHITH